MKAIRFGTLLAATFVSAVVSITASAGVCKIGTVEYDTLQEAFNSLKSASGDAKVTLLQDIDITGEISVPRFNRKKCTVDGAGHVIRQAYAGRMFNAINYFTYIAFTNVTILGGGEACSTVSSEVKGVFFHMQSGPSSLELESGCVISNFVYHSTLIGAQDNNMHWSIYVNPGCVIANNSASDSPGIFRLSRASDSATLYINGGEIYGNRAQNGTVAYLDGETKSRTQPIAVISGGLIHDNVVGASDITEHALFYCNKGPVDVNMEGGEIFNNTGSVFVIQYGGSTLSRIHLAGGKVFGNSGYAVCSYQSESLDAMRLSGDAIVAGNGPNGDQGLFQKFETVLPSRTALEGDFTGYASLTGDGGSQWAYHGNGKVYGTNLAHYAGAENIHLPFSDGSNTGKKRVLVTDAETGEMKWGEPNSAKIGGTEYATFSAALSAAGDGATIELLRDFVCMSSIVPPANKSITVDGAGFRIFRCGKDPIVSASVAGGNIAFMNVELNEGYFTCRDSYTNHIDGVLVRTVDGVEATVTLGSGTVLVGGRGTNALVRVASGAVVNLDGCTITGQVNRAVAASAGGTLGVRGATRVYGNGNGDIDVADGSILSLNGDLAGSVHVTVVGAEAYDGQRFGTRTGDWLGLENFVNGGGDPKLFVSKSGPLVWSRRGFVIMYR